MICSSCGEELPGGFPGATVVCSCGVPTTLVSTRSTGSVVDARPGAGPYRASGALPQEPLSTRCPFCGNECPTLVRICPHCDVRLENVRCAGCYSLQPPGSFACARCGQTLELEPLLDATDAPCPRCRTALEASSAWDEADPVARRDGRTHECPRCGGIFVPQGVLAEILCRAELQGASPKVGPGPSILGEVTYVPCPQCHVPMNRTNFGKASGVIVDVCRAHGTWFDGGELTRVVAFAASGGLAKARARAAAERKESDAATRANAHAEFAMYTGRDQVNERLEAWRDFLHSIFWF